MIKVTKSIILLMVFGVFLTFPASRADNRFNLREVRDEKQAVVTNATVTVRNVKTNETRTAQTDGEGRYRFTGMSVGDYEVTVESSGFAKYVQSGITLVLNQPATVDVTLKTGGVTEVVNVVENASMLNTTTLK